MITYEEALRVAKGRKKEINTCTEHENAYVFSYDDGSNEIVVGPAPVVVMKDDGRIGGGYQPILDGSIGDKIRDIAVKQG